MDEKNPPAWERDGGVLKDGTGRGVSTHATLSAKKYAQEQKKCLTNLAKLYIMIDHNTPYSRLP